MTHIIQLKRPQQPNEPHLNEVAEGYRCLVRDLLGFYEVLAVELVGEFVDLGRMILHYLL